MPLQLESLEDRLCPSLLFTQGGGPLLVQPQVVDLHTDTALVAFTDQAMQTIVSQYLPLLTPDYGVDTGSLAASLDLPALPGFALTNHRIQQTITTVIQSGQAPSPNAASLYVLFLSPNQSVTDEGGTSIAGYHSNFALQGQPIYYAVIYDAGAALTAQDMAAVESHEVAEAATDPLVGTGWVDRNDGTNREIADIYQWQQLFSLNGFLMMAPSGPQGQILEPLPVSPPSQPANPFVSFQELLQLPLEAFDALAFRCLALADPHDFAGPARQAQQSLTTNPLYATPTGQFAVQFGESAFLQALSSS